jgi:TonB family protein
MMSQIRNSSNSKRSFFLYSFSLHICVFFLLFLIIKLMGQPHKETMYKNIIHNKVMVANMVTISSSSGSGFPMKKAININQDYAKAKERIALARRKYELKLKDTVKPKPIKLESKPKPIKVESKPKPIKVESKPKPIKVESKVASSREFKSVTNMNKVAEDLKKIGLFGLKQRVNKYTSTKLDSFNKEKLTQYMLAIKNKIQDNWINPFQQRLSATVSLVLSLDGKVDSVHIVTSSGNKQFDQQLLLAINKSSPLPFPREGDLKEKMRKIKLKFYSNNI